MPDHNNSDISPQMFYIKSNKVDGVYAIDRNTAILEDVLKDLTNENQGSKFEVLALVPVTNKNGNIEPRLEVIASGDWHTISTDLENGGAVIRSRDELINYVESMIQHILSKSKVKAMSFMIHTDGDNPLIGAVVKSPYKSLEPNDLEIENMSDKLAELANTLADQLNPDDDDPGVYLPDGTLA